MDPITLIVTALTAGASAALKGAAEQAVKDAYGGLKSLLKRKFGGKPVAESVDQHEKAPEAWKQPLEQQLRDVGAGDDEEIIRAAQKVLAQTDPEGARAGKYNVTVSGGKGVVVGDRNTVTMTFEDKD